MNIPTFAYPNGIPFSHPVIRFYGILIVCGSLLALVLSNYRAYKDGFDKHFFDSIFLAAFPSGIVGARIWYVIASFDEFKDGPWYKVFAIWEGGLAIQGGIILGVLVGVIMAKYRRKGTPLLRITDYIVPTIGIAQIFGRWGNFFNQEVYGHNVSLQAWNFLPSFITNNMGTEEMLNNGIIWSPLFFVEGSINFMFYFVVAHALPDFLGKHYKDGDSTFAYFIAYGIVRMVLEPLRNPIFIMGVNQTGSKTSYRSFMMALIFVIVGAVCIFLNHLLRFLLDKGKIKRIIKKEEPEQFKTDSFDENANDSFSSFDEDKLTQYENKIKNEGDGKNG